MVELKKRGGSRRALEGWEAFALIEMRPRSARWGAVELMKLERAIQENPPLSPSGARLFSLLPREMTENVQMRHLSVLEWKILQWNGRN